MATCTMASKAGWMVVALVAALVGSFLRVVFALTLLLFILPVCGACKLLGLLSPAVISLLKTMARSAKSVTGYDSTPYGQSRSSPRTFFAHHAAALSCAIVYDGTFALRDWLAAEQRALALGVP